jgi:hypothetical protein
MKNKVTLKRIEEAECKAGTVRSVGPIRIVSGGCYTKEELNLIRAAEGPKEPCLNPEVVCIIGVETEKRPARPLAKLLELYNHEAKR